MWEYTCKECEKTVKTPILELLTDGKKIYFVCSECLKLNLLFPKKKESEKWQIKSNSVCICQD